MTSLRDAARIPVLKRVAHEPNFQKICRSHSPSSTFKTLERNVPAWKREPCVLSKSFAHTGYCLIPIVLHSGMSYHQAFGLSRPSLASFNHHFYHEF